MDISQIILIVVIVLLIVAYPILVSSRNKKERQKLDEQTNSLKRGDKVMTTSGIFGTVVDLHQEGERKIVTIETGYGKTKGYMAIDAYAIYTVMNEQSVVPEDVKAKENKEEKVEESEKVSAEDKKEEKVEKTEKVETKASETKSTKTRKAKTEKEGK